METIDEVCAICRTHLLADRTCPNRPCIAFGLPAGFSSRPPPRLSFQDLITVPQPSYSRFETAAVERDPPSSEPPSEDPDDRPTPIEVPVTPSGIRRPVSGLYPIKTLDDADGKVSNGKS